jgi:hypothetical protein
MATLTITPIKTFVSGETVTPAKLNELSQSTVALTAGSIVDADVSASAAIALSKLATGALPTAITVASANLVNGTIVNADINATAAIAGSKLADAGITAAKLDGAQTGDAPIYGCRAWVNFDGSRNEADTGASTNGANVKVRASGNVTSVLKNATGDYTITFTTAMPDANYAITASCSPLNDPTACRAVMAKSAATYLAGSVTVKTAQEAVGAADQKNVNVAIFR